jgi:uncharacterized protein
MTGNRLLAWIGPDPMRVDVAHIELGADRLAARGSSVTSTYALTYELETGPDWVTRRLEVHVDGDGWRRTLTLQRSTGGVWSSRRVDATRDAEPRPLTFEHPELGAALDCDLALCPLTNTMPVLREDLVGASTRGEARRAELTMAWVAVPELEVVSSEQRYAAGVPVAGGGAQIQYEAGSFREHIEVDADALVVSYPSIGRRLAG